MSTPNFCDNYLWSTATFPASYQMQWVCFSEVLQYLAVPISHLYSSYCIKPIPLSYQRQKLKHIHNIHNISMNPRTLSSCDPDTIIPWDKEKGLGKRSSPSNREHHTNIKLTISQHELVCSAPYRRLQLQVRSISMDTVKIELCQRKSKIKTVLVWPISGRLKDLHIHKFPMKELKDFKYFEFIINVSLRNRII